MFRDPTTRARPQTPTRSGDVELAPDLVSQIYETLLEPERWTEVLEKLTEFAGGTAGGLTLTTLWPEPGAVHRWSGLDPACERAYAHHYFRGDWLARAGQREEGTTLSARDIVAEGGPKGTLESEVCASHGVRDMSVTIVHRDPTRTVAFATFRPPGAKVDAEARRRLQAIVPHLGRVLRIAAALDDRERIESVLSAATAARRLGAVRVDASLHLLSASEGASSWLENEGGPLKIARRRLAAVDSEDEAALRAAVGAAIAGRVSNVVLGKRSGELVSVLVAPAPSGSPFSVDPSAHVLFSAPAEAARVTALRDAFALTPAEARVAVKVARGQPLRTIANDLGVSYHTVRAHLRQCFAKTGARRQSALAALVHDSA